MNSYEKRFAPDKESQEDASGGQPLETVEGIDYYLEDGLLVFTEHFLARRGYCCESGCRHCPYGYIGDGAES
ncbi:MAG TPA: DUF5522 domain-containing protein [Pyrinomonadaceae bacterium]|nr:DUF5522 domain-containing protein [Pyrinomonadaceae bacterium]